MLRKRLTWAQEIVLKAANAVDFITFGKPRHNLPYGVFRGLVHRGLIRQHSYGWEITEKGRERLTMEREGMLTGKRYAVSRTLEGWAVVDRSKAKIRMHNDIVVTFKTREEAREKVQLLNQEDSDEQRTDESDRGAAAAE